MIPRIDQIMQNDPNQKHSEGIVKFIEHLVDKHFADACKLFKGVLSKESKNHADIDTALKNDGFAQIVFQRANDLNS